VFNGEASRVARLITACKLYLRMRMRETLVEEKIQWILSYVQEGLADVWKENLLEDLESEEVELKKEFGGKDEESIKVAELKRIEQGGRMIEEFFQELRRAARESKYEGRALVEEFKRMNKVI